MALRRSHSATQVDYRVIAGSGRLTWEFERGVTELKVQVCGQLIANNEAWAVRA